MSAAQRAVIRRVATRIRLYETPPPELEPEDCLSQLLSSKDLYTQEPKNLASFCFEKLRVLKGEARPKDAQHLLPPHAGSLLRHCSVHIERPWDQVPDDLVLPKPYWDPVLANSQPERFRVTEAHLSLP